MTRTDQAALPFQLDLRSGVPVYRQIMEFYDKVGGFGHLIMVGKTGFITHAEAVKNITLFSREVLPRLREVKPVIAE